MQITSEDVRGWISIILTGVTSLIIGLFGLWKIFERKVNATAAALRKKHSEDFKRLEDNIFDVRTTTTTAIGRLEIVERRTDLAEQERAKIHEDYGELRASVQQLMNKLNEDKLDMKDVLNSIDNRLTRIETKLER
jgi:chromosome segregation ATPase